MTYYTVIQFCDERNREGLNGAQCLDDELLYVVTDFQGLKRGDGHLVYCLHIGICFTPNNDLRIQGFLLSLPCWAVLSLYLSLRKPTTALAIPVSSPRVVSNGCTYPAADDDGSAFLGQIDLRAHSG